LNILQPFWNAVSKSLTEIVNFERKLRQYLQKYRSDRMSIICTKCGHENQDDAFYCDECGEELKTNTLSSSEEETITSEEPSAELSSSEVASDEAEVDIPLHSDSEPEPVAESVSTEPEELEPVAESVSTESEELEPVAESVSTESEEPEPVAESVSTESEEPEQSTFSLPIGAPTRLEIDEPPIEQIVSPPTTLELPELPKAILINQETGEKFILPSEEKTAYIGRVNEEFPVQVDLSAIAHADLISRVHAAIHLENEVYYLEDAGSSNGTWLNEKQIQTGTRFRQQLNPGDTIAFGRNQTIKFTFDLEDS
jgi:hypothetical protein